jgi:hypothetical protein
MFKKYPTNGSAKAVKSVRPANVEVCKGRRRHGRRLLPRSLGVVRPPIKDSAKFHRKVMVIVVAALPFPFRDVKRVHMLDHRQERLMYQVYLRDDLNAVVPLCF